MKLLNTIFFTTILFLFYSFVISAQNSKIDSLSKLLNDNLDTIQVRILNDLCFSLHPSNPELALEYGLKAIKIAKELNYKKGLATAYNRVGIVYDVTSRYKEALENYNIALLLNNEIGNETNAAGVLNNIGMIHWNKGDYAKALSYYIKSAETLEKIGNENMLGNVYNNIGLIYFDTKEFDKSLKYFQDALALRKKNNDQYGISATLSNIGLLYNDKEDFEKSLEFYYESLKYKENLNDVYGLGIVYKGIAENLKDLNRNEEAIEYFNKAIKIKIEINDQYGLASSYTGLGFTYYNLKDYKTSGQYYLQAKEVAEKIKSDKILYKAFQGLASVNYTLGNYKQAYDYLKKSSSTYNKVYNEEKSKQISEMQTKYETEKKEQAIAILNRDNEIKQLQLNRKNLQLILIAITSFIILLIVGILYQRYRIKQSKLLQEIREKQQQERIKAIIETQEAERNRISKDLHDGIGQLLAAAKINFSSFEDELVEVGKEKKELFEHSTKILNEAITEVSSISQQMMPRVLRENGLIPAINNLLEKTLSKTNIHYNFQQVGWNGRVSESIEIGLYRIIQELIGNVVKHAKATDITILLTKTQKNIILTVEDNGIGMPKNLKKRGMGLDNIASRAESLGGIYHYESTQGEGTVSTVRIPL